MIDQLVIDPGAKLRYKRSIGVLWIYYESMQLPRTFNLMIKKIIRRDVTLRNQDPVDPRYLRTLECAADGDDLADLLVQCFIALELSGIDGWRLLALRTARQPEDHACQGPNDRDSVEQLCHHDLPEIRIGKVRTFYA